MPLNIFQYPNMIATCDEISRLLDGNQPRLERDRGLARAATTFFSGDLSNIEGRCDALLAHFRPEFADSGVGPASAHATPDALIAIVLAADTLTLIGANSARGAQNMVGLQAPQQGVQMRQPPAQRVRGENTGQESLPDSTAMHPLDRYRNLRMARAQRVPPTRASLIFWFEGLGPNPLAFNAADQETVGDLKRMIASRRGVDFVNQTLVFGNRIMDDSSIISISDLKYGDTIKVRSMLQPEIALPRALESRRHASEVPISVQVVGGPTSIYFANLDDTADDFKAIIDLVGRVPVEMQRLIFRSDQIGSDPSGLLEGNRSLRSYGIHSDTLLYLSLRMRGD